MTDEVHEERVDVLVAGAGMSGLTVGAYAALHGARVLVVEKGDEIGGSAIYAGGYVWTVESFRELKEQEAVGDPGLGHLLVEGYDRAITWLESRGVALSAPHRVLFGRGRGVDIQGYLESCVRVIEVNGGYVVRNCALDELLVDGPEGRVRGAILQDSGEAVSVCAMATVLTTGGFQGDPVLMDRYLGIPSTSFRIRANKFSTGDGLLAAIGAGAGVTARDNRGFYGHLVCSPCALDDPKEFRALSQYHSPYAVLVDHSGRRFTDESRGDHWNAQLVARRDGARALLVWDAEINSRHVLEPYIQGTLGLDKVEVANLHGARAAIAASHAELGRIAESWEVDGGTLLNELSLYNAGVQKQDPQLTPPRVTNRHPIESAPFYVMEVAAGVTFTHGGIRTDSTMRVLDDSAETVPGLYAAGVDVGDVFKGGYAGGLALALTTGLRCAETIIGVINDAR